MELPVNNTIYKEQSYWDERFEQEESYDWFTSYSAFRELMKTTLKHDSKLKILMLGKSCARIMGRVGSHLC